MSSEDLSPIRALDTRFSTPAPELDDHRRRPRARGSPRVSRSPQPQSPSLAANQNSNLPALELSLPSPQGQSHIDLLRVDEGLRNQHASNPIARDFEHAVSEHSEDEVHVAFGHGRRPSALREVRRSSVYRDNRGRRRVLNDGDRSRDASSSRSTSPANSVEAFAAPPRRARTATLESLPSLHEFQRSRKFSLASGGRHHATVSHVNCPPECTTECIARATNEAFPDHVGLEVDEEPGKTYRIDFEELDEFVALCNQGVLPGESTISEPSTLVSDGAKVFDDLRQDEDKYDMNNVALNSETFYEKPGYAPRGSITQLPSGERLVRQKQLPKDVQRKRFTLFSSEIKKPMEVATLCDFVANGDTFRDLFDIGPDGGTWWLDVQNPTSAELEVIAKAFKIHRLTKEDIETQEAREKVELFTNYYFVCFRTFNPDKDSDDFLDPLPVFIVVTTDGVLSFSYNQNPHTANVRKRIAKLGDFVSLGPDYICYAMIDDIVDSFGPIIEEAEAESENIEDQVFTAREEDFLLVLRQIAECRKRVLNMMRLLGGKADVIKGFAKRCNEQYAVAPRGDIGLYLGDIQDHVVTMMSNLAHVERLLSRSHGNYLAQLNVDHIMKGNHTNHALAKITVLASIIVPLNIITGLFGMNVHVPGEQVMDDNYAWFFGIVGVIVTFIIISFFIAKKTKYI